MVLRILTATLRAALLPIVGEDDVDSAVAAVISLGWRPPFKTLLTVEEVEALPNGTPVLIGALDSRHRVPAFGFKCEYGVEIQGDPHPYPLHDPNSAPPLPCTVVWTPANVSDFGVYADGTEGAAVIAQMLPPDPDH